MGTVGGLASLARPEPLRIRLGSVSFKINNRHDLQPPSTIYLFFSTRMFPIIFFPHRDERLRQHGVAAASSSPGRTDDSAILGQLRIHSANQLTYNQIQNPYTAHVSMFLKYCCLLFKMLRFTIP